MDRKDFLVTIGKGAALAGLVYCVGCSPKNTDNPVAPSNVDVTLDLTLHANQPLNTIGGSVVNNGIVVGRVSQTSFVAVSAACTHQGTTVEFQLQQNQFFCPNHGSTYTLDGVVTQGPAQQSLTKYNTSLSGTNLRIYS
ncbi:MAG: Rieske 2Fe-2S domain-containing protein [Ignavibacteriaceae bacterium]|nr:Rieske 2Fe-2S domain-containing protein [Ignavibacteriaceae bacterium]